MSRPDPCNGRSLWWYFGDGSGAEFFMGPYLKVLPDVVNGLIKELEVQ
jgi:hypothetical protein